MQIQTIRLNDGVEIPVYGFGTYQIPADGSTYRAVRQALALGIRHIDTAAAYFNEHEVGKAIRESGIARDEIFLTSKLWLQDYGYEAAKKGIEISLRKLNTDYMDLYLKIQYSGENLTEDDSNKLTVGKLISNVQVLKVVDANGDNVFADLENKKTPAQIIFAVPSEYHILLRKAMYLRTYDSTIIPVPIKVNTEETPDVTISSSELRDFINRVTAWTGDGTNSGELEIPTTE